MRLTPASCSCGAAIRQKGPSHFRKGPLDTAEHELDAERQSYQAEFFVWKKLYMAVTIKSFECFHGYYMRYFM
jgi:hypothetical protein